MGWLYFYFSMTTTSQHDYHTLHWQAGLSVWYSTLRHLQHLNMTSTPYTDRLDWVYGISHWDTYNISTWLPQLVQIPGRTECMIQYTIMRYLQHLNMTFPSCTSIRQDWVYDIQHLDTFNISTWLPHLIPTSGQTSVMIQSVMIQVLWH